MNQQLFSDSLDDNDSEAIKKLPGPIFIVGASGFIGAKLFFALAKRRNDVYAVSSLVDRSWRLAHFPSSLSQGRLISLDVTDRRKVKECLERYRPKTIFNLSAYGAYERQNVSHKIYEVNFMGTFNLIHSLYEQGCYAFVQAGSSSEYGLNCKAPKEDDHLKPNSDYSVSKGAASLLIQYFGNIKNFPCSNLRLYSIYGPWEDRDRLIPKLVTHGLASTLPPFADKEISRDFVYVDDCIMAFVNAALTICQEHPGISVNVATGIKTSLEEVAISAKRLFNITLDPEFGSMGNRKWDLSNWYGDPSSATEKMKWRPKVKFQDGLQMTAEWERTAADILRIGIMPKKTKKVSAIVACYRDYQAIPVMYKRLKDMFEATHYDYEIVFVNDNSPASDEQEIIQLSKQDSHVIGISHSRNFGSQSAFLSGMEVASGDAVVLMDGDLQDPPEIIPAFIAKWEEKFDIVYGIRIKREAAWYMQLFYKIFYRIFKSFADIAIPVDAGDFSLIDRKVVEQLIKLPEKDVFLRGLRAWVGYKQTGVPYVRPERMFGQTTNSFLKNIWWAKKGIFSFSTKPLSYIQGLGVFIFSMSVALSLFYLALYFIKPPDGAKGVTTIVLLVLGMGGIQLLSVSILGDYLGKVLEEVKNRPRFIRSKIITSAEILETQHRMDEYINVSREEANGKYR